MTYSGNKNIDPQINERHEPKKTFLEKMKTVLSPDSHKSDQQKLQDQSINNSEAHRTPQQIEQQRTIDESPTPEVVRTHPHRSEQQRTLDESRGTVDNSEKTEKSEKSVITSESHKEY